MRFSRRIIHPTVAKSETDTECFDGGAHLSVPKKRSSRQLASSAPVDTFAIQKNLGIRRRF
jgi:hypothetical protein